MNHHVLRRATIWMTSIGLSLLLALVPFVRSSDASDQAVATAAPTTTTATPTPDTSMVDEALAKATGNVSVSVADLTSGSSATYGDSAQAFDTASIVKVDILAALLLQAQDEGRTLTEQEKSLAASMIENSDNDAATALFEEIGGKSELDEANKRLGLKATEVGVNGYWGLTETTSKDQVALLKQVFTDDSVLSGTARAYVQSLMADVEDSQRFGVAAAADDPQTARLKVGWLQRSATGLWVVDSIGMVERSGHTYLVAVLSDGNTSYDGGVALVDAVALAAVDATI